MKSLNEFIDTLQIGHLSLCKKFGMWYTFPVSFLIGINIGVIYLLTLRCFHKLIDFVVGL